MTPINTHKPTETLRHPYTHIYPNKPKKISRGKQAQIFPSLSGLKPQNS